MIGFGASGLSDVIGVFWAVLSNLVMIYRNELLCHLFFSAGVRIRWPHPAYAAHQRPDPAGRLKGLWMDLVIYRRLLARPLGPARHPNRAKIDCKASTCQAL